MRPMGAAAAAWLIVWGTGDASAAAELTNACTVSVENRSAPVDANGAWVIPGVPATGAPLRVRATCVEEGVTRSGQSDWFQLAASTIVRVPEIDFSAPAPIPARITVASPVPRFTAIGESQQLSVMATYADGSTKELTSSAAGTAYASSNRAILEVDAGGRVTARASGVALVIATNEGAVAVLPIQVVVSGDSDGDGLPDDWELANGLNPNDPVDAFEDPDNDSLSTADEFTRGTDPANPDTDGDGLLDGEEVLTTGTNPVLRDTDGDQVPDGLELRAGSNPLDRLSVSLNGILLALQVSPSRVTLVFNTVLGEASQQLQVRATLLDGTVIDATSRLYGTSYTSSNLAIVSFGAGDGLIFGGAAGQATVTARISGFSAASVVTIETFTPRALGTLSLPGALGVDLAGAYAFVVGTSLQVVNIADPTRPQLVATLGSVSGRRVKVAGNLAFVSGGDLQIVDVSAPTSPVLLSTSTPSRDVDVAGDKAYVVDGVGLRVLDIGAPTAPVLLGGVDIPGGGSVSVVGQLALVGAGDRGVFVVDVGDPLAPRVLGSTSTRQNGLSRVADLVARGRFAYVADGPFGDLGGLREIDFGVPELPVLVGTTGNAFGLSAVDVERSIAAAADYYFVNSIILFDVSGRVPVFRSTIDFPGNKDGVDIAVQNGLVAEIALGSGTSVLQIGRYAIFASDAGQPPTIELTSPLAGVSGLERRFFRLAADARDDSGVERVSFYADGELVGSRFGPPWEVYFQLPHGRASVEIQAVAIDFDGRSADSAPVSLAVIDDPEPTVELLSPAPGVVPSRGATITIAATASDDTRVARVELYADGLLVGSLTAAPFKVDYALPAALTQVEIRAIAVDEIGQTATASRAVPLAPDEPPIVAIVQPPPNSVVGAGSVVHLVAAGADDFAITVVRASAAGQVVAELTQPPYDFALVAPTSPGRWSVSVSAYDRLGQMGTASVDLRVVEAPPTTSVVGSIVDAEGIAVGGALVFCNGRPGQSRPGGTFEIGEVTPVDGKVSCRGSFQSLQGQITGRSALVLVGSGGVTDVGVLRLGPPGYPYPHAVAFDDSAQEIVLGDFNGDGIVDVGSGIYLAAGLAGGRFGALLDPIPPDIVFDPSASAVADFDADGRLDIALADSASGRIYVRLGRGDGTFDDIGFHESGQNPVACEAADIDGDQRTDLVVANRGSSSVAVLSNSGGGTFATYQTLSVAQPTDLALADLDGDGLVDLAVGSEADRKVEVYRGSTAGFVHAVGLSTAGIPLRIRATEVTGDALPDLVVGVAGDPARPSPSDGIATIPTLPGLGFGPARFMAVGGRPEAFDLESLDGDANRDLVVGMSLSVPNASPSYQRIVVLRGVGDGTFSPSCTYAFQGRSIRDVELADLDGDGSRDLLVGGADRPVTLAYGDGSGCFEGSRAESAAFPAPYLLDDTVPVDLNRDGLADRLELWVSNTSLQLARLLVRLGTGGGSTSLAQTIQLPSAFPRFVGTADFNGDGRMDAYATSVSKPGSGGAQIFLGIGDGRLDAGGLELATGVREEAHTADFDGDGWPDFTYKQGSDFDRVIIKLGKGDGTFGGDIVALPARGIFTYPSILPGDFDGDGKDDLVNYTGVGGGKNGIEFYKSNGNGTFASPVVSAEKRAAKSTRSHPATRRTSIAAADLDGDGNLDLVAGGFIWLNLGGGRFSTTDRLASVVGDFALADVDGDGDTDIFHGPFSRSVFQLLSNDGSGHFQKSGGFELYGCDDVDAADLDGDGAVDFACKQRQYQTFTAIQH